MDNLMVEHVLDGVSAFAADPLKLGLFLSSFLVAAVLYSAVRKEANLRRKSLLMFLNLLAVAFPLTLLAFSLSCSAIHSLECAVTLSQTFLLAFPASLVLAFAFYYLLIPTLQTLNCAPIDKANPLAAFVRAEAALLGIPAPRLMVLQVHEPVAYSMAAVSPTIVVSVGVLELLTRKEQEAVALHELYHLSRRSPSFKVLSVLYGRFLPLSRPSFFNDLSKDELAADGHAGRVQGTGRFVASAKAKFSAAAKFKV